MSDLVTTGAWFDDDKLIIKNTQDVTPVLERNRDLRLADKNAASEMRHVASIPLVVVEEWRKAGIDIYDKNDHPKILQMLNSGDWAKLRTDESTI